MAGRLLLVRLQVGEATLDLTPRIPVSDMMSHIYFLLGHADGGVMMKTLPHIEHTH